MTEQTSGPSQHVYEKIVVKNSISFTEPISEEPPITQTRPISTGIKYDFLPEIHVPAPKVPSKEEDIDRIYTEVSTGLQARERLFAEKRQRETAELTKAEIVKAEIDRAKTVGTDPSSIAVARIEALEESINKAKLERKTALSQLNLKKSALVIAERRVQSTKKELNRQARAIVENPSNPRVTLSVKAAQLDNIQIQVKESEKLVIDAKKQVVTAHAAVKEKIVAARATEKVARAEVKVVMLKLKEEVNAAHHKLKSFEKEVKEIKTTVRPFRYAPDYIKKQEQKLTEIKQYYTEANRQYHQVLRSHLEAVPLRNKIDYWAQRVKNSVKNSWKSTKEFFGTQQPKIISRSDQERKHNQSAATVHGQLPSERENSFQIHERVEMDIEKKIPNSDLDRVPQEEAHVAAMESLKTEVEKSRLESSLPQAKHLAEQAVLESTNFPQTDEEVVKTMENLKAEVEKLRLENSIPQMSYSAQVAANMQAEEQAKQEKSNATQKVELDKSLKNGGRSFDNAQNMLAEVEKMRQESPLPQASHAEARKQAEEKAKKKAEEQALKQVEEQARKQAEAAEQARKQKQLEALQKQKEEAEKERKRKEEEERKRKEEEERKRIEEEERKRKEEEERKRKAAERSRTENSASTRAFRL